MSHLCPSSPLYPHTTNYNLQWTSRPSWRIISFACKLIFCGNILLLLIPGFWETSISTSARHLSTRYTRVHVINIFLNFSYMTVRSRSIALSLFTMPCHFVFDPSHSLPMPARLPVCLRVCLVCRLHLLTPTNTISVCMSVSSYLFFSLLSAYVYVRVCVCVYVCVYVCMYVCVYVCMYVFIELFGNLLLLYCKYEYYDLAADVLAENSTLTYRLLSPVSRLAEMKCVCLSVFMCLSDCMPGCMCACVRTCMRACMRACVCVCSII